MSRFVHGSDMYVPDLYGPDIQIPGYMNIQ